jgi:hypothetical protein
MLQYGSAEFNRAQRKSEYSPQGREIPRRTHVHELNLVGYRRRSGNNRHKHNNEERGRYRSENVTPKLLYQYMK